MSDIPWTKETLLSMADKHREEALKYPDGHKMKEYHLGESIAFCHLIEKWYPEIKNPGKDRPGEAKR